MRHPRSVIVLLALVCAALALSACGGSDKPAADQPRDVEDQLGFDQDGILARQSRVEAAVRDCMKNQGFDYVPVDPVAQRAALFGSSRLSEDDFINQFGYGISTLWGRATATTDPNQRVRAALGSADRRAYDRALWGDHPGTTFSSAVDNGDFSQLGGCVRRATTQVFGGTRVLSQLQSRLDALEERMLQDQRMVQGIEKWSSCMAAAGFRYEEPEAIDTDLYKRAEKIVGPLPGQFATGPEPGEKPPPYDRAALAALQRDEVAIAKADHACELKYIAPVENKIAPRYQAQFRRQNQDLIAQVRPAR
jgi:hypothetical protein